MRDIRMSVRYHTKSGTMEPSSRARKPRGPRHARYQLGHADGMDGRTAASDEDDFALSRALKRRKPLRRRRSLISEATGTITHWNRSSSLSARRVHPWCLHGGRKHSTGEMTDESRFDARWWLGAGGGPGAESGDTYRATWR